MKSYNVSVIIVGSNHVNTLGLIRSVGEIGIKPFVILEPCNPQFCNLRFSKYISQLHILKDPELLITTLQDLSNSIYQKAIILCGSDNFMSIIDANYDKLKQSFYAFNINNTQGLINKYLNKTESFELARSVGFDLIKTWNPQNPYFNISHVVYPCIVKGNNSTKNSKGDMLICNNKIDLQRILRTTPNLIIQEFINKDFELDIVGLSIHHGKEIYIGGVVRKIRETLEAQSQFDVLEPLSFYPNINFDMVKNLVAELKYEGIFSVEIMCRDDKVFFLEINLRNDGTSYMYTASGFNYAKAWIDYCENNSTSYMKAISISRPHYLMQITDTSNLIRLKITPWHWIKDLLKCDVFFVFSLQDIKPFLYQIYIPFRQLIKKPFKLFKKHVS